MDNATHVSINGSKGESFELVVTKASICMFVLVLSLIENIAVLVILKQNYGNRMRTANSFFIANMSVADVFFAAQNIPHAYNNYILKARWILLGNIGMILCKIDAFFSLISMVTTNLTILAIAVDRVFAVYVPFKKIITRRVCYSIIFLTWFISTLFASPMLYYADLKSKGKEFVTCTLTNKEVMKTWYTVLAGILATTLITMLTLYTAIGVKLGRRKLPGNASQRGNRRREKRNRDIFKMLITLIIAFHVCSLPLFTLQLSHTLGFYELLKINQIRFIALLLFFLNGAINPMIYVTFNESFRDGVKAALPKCCKFSRGVVYTVNRHAGTSRRSADSGNSGRSSTQL